MRNQTPIDRGAIELLKRVVRQPYAWPGGYALIGLMSDGESVCAKCLRSEFKTILQATKERDRGGWQLVDVFVHWEGDSLYCAHCNAEIAPEYTNN